jgi:hypothetical protein
MVARLLTLLRRNDATAAIETLLSVPLIFMVIMMFWSGMIVVYNQSTINQATQTAAQGALTVFDRQTYRNGQTSGYLAGSTPLQRARAAATSIFNENSRGMLTEQFGNDKPSTALTSFTIFCGANLDDYQSTSPCPESGGPLERVSITAAASSGYWLLSPVANNVAGADQGMAPTADQEQHKAAMTATGDAISVGPVTP